MMRGRFRLFPEEQRWWSFADYEQLLALMQRFRPRTVLEFGPGWSTLALVEGGAEVIDTCEDDTGWYRTQQERLRAHQVVNLHLYQHDDVLTIPAVDFRRYDLAFVDGPRDTPRRPVEIAFAAARSRVVATHDATSAPVRDALERLGAAGWAVEVIPFLRTPNGDANALGVAVAP
jgi:predicted O-methyltransferase YrrM